MKGSSGGGLHVGSEGKGEVKEQLHDSAIC